MLPLIVVEDLVAPFKFWRDGIHEGMLYRNDFYVVLQRFASAERTEAHTQALREGNRGFKVCITVSKAYYTVWVEMRSQGSAALPCA